MHVEQDYYMAKQPSVSDYDYPTQRSKRMIHLSSDRKQFFPFSSKGYVSTSLTYVI